MIVDTVGTAPYSRSKDALSEDGRLLLVFADLPAMLSIPWVALTSGRKVIGGVAMPNVDDLRVLAEMAEAGAFKPAVGRRYPFDQLPDAFAYVATGHKRGNVVITLEPDA